jgi:hypothetical protein
MPGPNDAKPHSEKIDLKQATVQYDESVQAGRIGISGFPKSRRLHVFSDHPIDSPTAGHRPEQCFSTLDPGSPYGRLYGT